MHRCLCGSRNDEPNVGFEGKGDFHVLMLSLIAHKRTQAVLAPLPHDLAVVPEHGLPDFDDERTAGVGRQRWRVFKHGAGERLEQTKA